MRLRKNNDMLVAKFSRETGILGAYETALINTKAIDDKAYTSCFLGEEMQRDGAEVSKSRTMQIDGKWFHICSVFPANPETKPIEKLLTLIDTDIEKERQAQ